MIAAALIGLSCGMLIGQRFKVFALVPAHLLAGLVVAVSCAAAPTLQASAWLVFFLWSVAAQLGFLSATCWERGPAVAPRMRSETPGTASIK